MYRDSAVKVEGLFVHKPMIVCWNTCRKAFFPTGVFKWILL